MPALFKMEAFDGVAGQLYCIGLIVVLNVSILCSVFTFDSNCCGTVVLHYISIQEDYDGIPRKLSNFNFQSGQKPFTIIV